MRTALRTALAALLLVAAAASPAAAKEYSAESFDVRVRVLPGNLLEVTETIVFRFEDGAFSYVFRDIPARRTDGIEVLSATMDGRRLPFGDQPNQVEVNGDSRVRVRWRFQPVEDSAHTFGLTYRVRGAVRRGDGAGDELFWQALPGSHDYAIAASTVTFELPSLSAGALPAEPRLETRRVSGASAVEVVPAAEAGDGLTVRARADDIRKNGWLAVRLALPNGQIIVSPPDWQAEAARAAALGLYWLAGAGGVVLAGLIVLFGIRQQYDPVPSDIGRLTPTAMAPEGLDPAIAGALVSNGRPSHPHAVAVLFGLAERGAVEIDEQPRSAFGQRRFIVRRGRARTSLSPHERALLDLLFDGQDTATLPDGWRRVGRHFKKFSASVTEQLRAEGLIDPDRVRVRKRVFGFAVLSMILAGVGLAGAGILSARFGPWPFAIPGALAILGIIGLIVGGATTPLSNTGARRAARWRAYKEGLKDAAEAGGPSFAPRAADALALAVAMGLGGLWSKQLKKHPHLAPAWFQGLEGSDPAAIAALVSMGDASQGGAGGAGAAGAAGGGASGAG